MGAYRLHSAAARDLESIYEYSLSQWGPAQTEKYLSGLRKLIERIVAFPKSGRETYPGSPVRKAVHGQHTIFYRPVPDGIEIGRIFSRGQDFALALSAYEDYARWRADRERFLSQERETDQD